VINELPDPVLTPVYHLKAVLGTPLECGDVLAGHRRVVPLAGGMFTGPELNGNLLPGGSAGWQTVLPDGTALGKIRYTLRTDSEAEDRRVTTRSIAVGANASENHIGKAVARLADLGMVHARRGRVGGLTLTDAGRRTSIGWLVRRLEGDREVIECGGANPCPLVPACRLRRALAEAKEAFYRELDRYTIGDLIRDTTLPVILGPPLSLGFQPDRQPAERTVR